MNKIDLVDDRARDCAIAGRAAIPVSVRTGANLDGLLMAITERVASLLDREGPMPLTRARHRAALHACREALGRAATAGAAELVAEDLRLATRALGRITGRVDVEDVLDVIFREFCIGK
jgi:tRNA modification GTPase